MWFTLQSPSHRVFGIPWEYGTMVVFTADLLTQFHSVSKFPSPPPTHTTKINTGRKHEQNGEKKTVRVPCPFSSLAPPLAAPLLPRLLGNGCARIEVEALVLRAHLLHLKAEAGQSVRRVEHPTVEVKQGPKGEGRGTL